MRRSWLITGLLVTLGAALGIKLLAQAISPGSPLPPGTTAQPLPAAADAPTDVAALLERADRLMGDVDRVLNPPKPADAALTPATTKVLRGLAKHWRTLWNIHESQDVGLPPVLVGNLDGDPDQELFVNDLARDEVRAYEADGKFRVLTPPRKPADAPGSADQHRGMLRHEPGDALDVRSLWDYDGDGVDDYVCCDQDFQSGPGFGPNSVPGDFAPGIFHASGGGGAWTSDDLPLSSSRTFVISLQGDPLATLPGTDGLACPCIADLDGDGNPDLLLLKNAELPESNALRGLRAFGRAGKVLLDLDMQWAGFDTVGDIDGDSKAELINHGNTSITVAGVGQATVDVPGMPPDDIGLSPWPDWCYDFDGDGRAELVTSEGQVFNLASRHSFQLEAPRVLAELNLNAHYGENMVGFRQGKQRLVAGLIQREVSINDQPLLGIWSLQGKLLYLEDFQAKASQLRVLHAGGVDHLILNTEPRLLVWP